MENLILKGVLKTVSNETKPNVNGTLFRSCTVDINGTVYFAKVWEKSFQNGIKVGSTYDVEGIVDGDKLWLTLLNGTKAVVATPEMFAHLTV